MYLLITKNVVNDYIRYIYSLYYVLICRVTLKDLKGFLPRVNCKLSTNRLREVFQEVDVRRRNELGFDDFAELYHKLMFDDNVSTVILFKIGSILF